MVDKIKLTVNALRREKSANYTRDEKHLLLDKITPFLDIIENKKTDTVTVEAKTRAWVQVTSNYNAANPRGTRKINQLKNLYENLKKRVKKDILVDREEFRQRGIRTTNGRIDDVGWRLIKLLPRLKILYAGPNSTHIVNTDNESIKQHCPLTIDNKDSSDGTQTNTANTDEVNIKEEILHHAVDLEILPEGYCPEDGINLTQNSDNRIDEIEDNPMETFSSVATQTDEMFDMEREMKRKEIDKLNVEIQMKQLEVEYMRAKLREQELQVKFREMEYQIKYKEYIK